MRPPHLPTPARMSSLRGGLLVSLLAMQAVPAAAIGILVPTDPSVPPLRLVHHRVEARVMERGATTRVTQEFDNPTDRPLEATYLFPLPKHASVDEFALWMNGKRETGKVLERQEARRIYENIVRRTRDPGLIEYVDAQLFEARVFPIPPRGRQKVELTYTHLVDYEGGTHRYVYPMKTDQAAAATLEDFTFHIEVQGKMPLRNLYSPTHRVAATLTGERAIASFEESAFRLDQDFILFWQVDDRAVGMTLLSYQAGDDPGYFLLLLSPDDRDRDEEIIGKRITFIVDTSGSMAGEKMRAVKRALDDWLTRLRDDDLFQIVWFGGAVETYAPAPVRASAAEKARARQMLAGLEPMGGTAIDAALARALEGVPATPSAPHLVVFLTDGRPTVGETDTGRILGRVASTIAPGTRLFTFGVGNDVEPLLLDQLALQNGGTPAYLEGNASAEHELKAFYERISHPVWTNIAVDIAGAAQGASDVRIHGLHPRTWPDLFRGGQVLALGRYRGQGPVTVTLRGTTRRGEGTLRYEGSLVGGDTQHAFIPRLWAQREVAELLEQVRLKGESPDLVQEITQLATAFGIVTPYTSYLVLEPGQPLPPPDVGPFPPPVPLPRPVSRPWGKGRSERASSSAAADAFAPEMEEGISSGGAPAARGRELLRAESGAGAVAAAKEIGKLRESALAEGSAAATSAARALGRTFVFRDGAYVDERAKPSDEVLHIRTYSDAYFLVLHLRPEWKEALGLGERVTLQVRPGQSLRVSPEGDATPSWDQLRAFVARAGER